MLSVIQLPNWNQPEKNPISRKTDSGAPPTLPGPGQQRFVGVCSGIHDPRLPGGRPAGWENNP